MSNIWHKNERDTSSPVHLSLLFMYKDNIKMHQNMTLIDLAYSYSFLIFKQK